MQSLLRKMAAATLSACMSLSVIAADLTDVNDIVERANLASYYQGNDGRSEVRMTITDGQGREQQRQFTILRLNEEPGGRQHFYVAFSRPADVRDTVFMVTKNITRDDDRWLYLPSLDLVRRISAGDKRTSFVGSHFFYEDVSGRQPTEDEHRLVGTTDAHYIIESEPKDSSTADFASYRVIIDKANFLPSKIEYADASGQVYRTVEALEVQNIQGLPTVIRSQVSDLRSGGHTVMEFGFVSYNIGIPADVFSERSLRRQPREWLRRPQ